MISEIDRILAGEYSPSDINALSEALQGYLDGESDSLDATLAGGHPHGLRRALRDHRWRAAIAKAVALVDRGQTTHSLAKTLHEGFNRIEHKRRPPPEPFLAALWDARMANPNGGTAITPLTRVIETIRHPS